MHNRKTISKPPTEAPLGLFSKDQPAAEPARKSAGRQALPLLLLAAIVLVVLFTGYVAITVAAILAHELRRVRARWYLLWAAVTFLIALLMAGSITAWIGWNLAQVGHLVPNLLPHDPADVGSPLTIAAAFTDRSLASAVAAQLISAAPVAMMTTAMFVRYRSFARAERGKIEGDRFANIRPVGVLDRARIERNRRRIAAGYYLPELPELPDIDTLRAKLPAAQPNPHDQPAEPDGPPAPTAEQSGPPATADDTGHGAATTSAAPAPQSQTVHPEHPAEPAVPAGPPPAPAAPVDPDDPFADPTFQHTIRRART